MVKKIWKIFIAMPVILVLLLIFIELGIMIANNCVALQSKNDIEEISLPEKTEILETISGSRKYNGNGNGMQYFGAILVKSDLSLEELDKYYAQYRESEWDYIVENQYGQRIEAVGNNLSFKTNAEEDNYYIVYSWGDTDCELIYHWDWRGK